ncbi:hypothetical protein RRG08_055766 [Elysia crispata]|uniref:Uncharacterized protein n=1 Tax=Elysia crispata TaxID=231223 RepID=A0AAE1AAY9_9GAST|nr:hypothetical protein RRG08_055766 [Elysia crispata]
MITNSSARSDGSQWFSHITQYPGQRYIDQLFTVDGDGTLFIDISQKEETEKLRLYCEIDCPTPRRVAKDRLSKRSLENPEWSSSISADSSNGQLEWPVHARVKRGSSGRGISLEEGRIKTNGLDNFGQR